MIISLVSQLVAQLDVSVTIATVPGNLKMGFGFGPAYWANLLNDEYEFETFLGGVFLDQPITTEYLITQSGYIGEFYPITLFFMLKSELDYTPEQQDENCIDPANEAIRQFLAICQTRTELVDEIKDPVALEFTNLYDVNVSGKSLTLKIKPNIVKGICVPAIPVP